MTKRYHSIANDLIHQIAGNKPIQNLYACNVGFGGRVTNERRIMISIDHETEVGLRADEIDDLTQHSSLDQNPLTEWVSVVVAYFPKKSRPFRFYFRKNPAHIRGAIAQLQIIPDLKNHKREKEYTATWKIFAPASKIFPAKLSETELRNLLTSEAFQKACASQISRYLRLHSVQSKSYKVDLSPVACNARYQVISKQ